MVTRTKPDATTLPYDIRASGTQLTWSIFQGPITFKTGSVTYTDRTKGVDWRKLIKEGQDATTKASGFVRTYNGDQTYLLAKHKVTGVYTGQKALDNTGFTGSTGHYNQAWELAIGDAISNAKAVQHEFNAGSFLAELRETIMFLVAPLSGIRRQSLRYMTRIKGRHLWREPPKSKLRRLSDLWLSYRFGVLPLLSDIDSAMLELANKTVGQPPTLPFRGRGKWETCTESVTSGANLSIWSYYRDLITYSTTDVTIRGRVRLKLPTQIIYPPGLIRTFEDFVPSLYEAVPFSWAIDYFTNLGDILNCLGYCSANIVWSNWTARSFLKRVENLTYKELQPSSYDYYSSKGRNSVVSYRLWDRDTIDPSYLVPHLVYKLPIESPIKMCNLLAVTFQKFR
jgi:hypothetical protein